MSASPVEIGEILAGKYRVERVLGQGAMGVVVAATHLGLGQLVALKFMLAKRTAQQEQTERFLREARIAVKLRSQHAARVLDVGVLDSGAPYLVMELLDGRDLASLLEGGATIAVEDAVEYVLHVCEAIGEAHASGIVHRDLKPANLFLTTDTGGAPCVKVLDFGVSKLTGAELQLTGTVQALGSPLYMSPEQMKAAREVDGRSDIWSLGIVLFELLAGTTPFHAETLPELCAKVFFGEPLALSSLRPDVPAALGAVILGCLEKDRSRRFQSMAGLAAALAPFASPRARIYADRVAAIQGVDVLPSRSTDLLPPAEQSGERRISLAATPVIAKATAIVPSGTGAATARGRTALVAAVLGAAMTISIAVYLGLRPRGQEVPAVDSSPSMSAALPPSAAPSVTAPIVAAAPPTASATPTPSVAPPPSGHRPPAGLPSSKPPRPGYEGPRR